MARASTRIAPGEDADDSPLCAPRRRLEAAEEDGFVRRMRRHKVLTRKMNGAGFRSWPDRMVLVPGGKPLLIEFKRPGSKGRLTPQQAELHSTLQELGYDVETHTSAEEAERSVLRRLRRQEGG